MLDFFLVMDRLLDVVPVHLRFNNTEGVSLTRNIIIRSIASATIPIEVALPGPPFRVVLGGERVEKGTVRLSPGETLPLRVALDRGALPPGRPACEFLVLRVELCQPLPVDIVAVPDGMAEDAVRQLIASRLQDVPGIAPTAAGPAVAAADARGGGNSAAPSSTTAGRAQEEVATASAAPVEGTRPPPPAALLAYLGEAPTGAALRGPGDASAPVVASTSRSSRRESTRRARIACDSDDDDSPEPAPRSSGGRRSAAADEFYDDDRPPTPAPEGFEMVDEGCVPLNFCGVRNSPRNRNGSGAASAASTPLSRASAEVPSIAPVAPASSQLPSKAAVAAPSRAAAAAKDAPRKSEARASQGLVDLSAEGLFLIEGVGWCDEFGRTVAGLDGVRRASSTGAALGNLETTAKPLETTAKPRPQGKSRASASSNAVAGNKPLKKISAKDRDAAWDALGGI